MLSRVAENLFWMSRYLERAENVARLLDIGIYLELDAARISVDNGSAPVEIALRILACADAFKTAAHPLERGSVLRFLTFDRSNPQSILSMIGRARENARSTQESLGVDAWSEVNRLYLYLSGRKAQRKFESSPADFYAAIKHSCVLFDGLIQNSLPRDEVYHFLQLGRCLERADVLARILHAKCQTLSAPVADSEMALHIVEWTSLLRSCSAYGAYLRTERDRVDPVGVIRFLVLNPDFPRAIRFGVARCRESLQEITGNDEEDETPSEAERLLGRLDSELRYIDVGEIFERGLLSFLAGIQSTCSKVGLEISRSYFLT
jgi:uncharacterized alpha-E superfamily protein